MGFLIALGVGDVVHRLLGTLFSDPVASESLELKVARPVATAFWRPVAAVAAAGAFGQRRRRRNFVMQHGWWHTA